MNPIHGTKMVRPEGFEPSNAGLEGPLASNTTTAKMEFPGGLEPALFQIRNLMPCPLGDRRKLVARSGAAPLSPA